MRRLFDPSIQLRVGSTYGKPLWLLNIVLSLTAALIGGALVKAWITPIAAVPRATATKPLPETAAPTWNPTTRPPLTQFDILVERNPFKQPPPVPVGPASAPPPVPPPTLIGTMLVGQERKAILSQQGKANIYSVGQEVAGGTVTDIREDRVLYKRGDAISEITLKAPIQPGAASRPPVAVSSPAGPPPRPPLPQPTQAVEGAPTRPPLSEAERRRLRILQQRGLPGRPQDREQ